MKFRLFVVGMIAAIVAASVYAVTISDVASYAQPAMVDEINTSIGQIETALNNGNVITGSSFTVTFPSNGIPTKGNVQAAALGTASNNIQMIWDLLRTGNDTGGTTTGTVNYAQIYAVASDVTGGTEDANIDFYVMVNGTLTKVLTMSSTGISYGTLASAVTVNSLVVSNDLATIKGSNVVVSAGGAFTVGTGGTVSLPSASVPSAALPAIIANSAFSNVTGRVNCSNLTVTAGSTVTFPAASIAKDALNSTYHFAGVGSNITIAVTNGLITSITLI